MTVETQLPWVTEANKHVGLKEVPGKAANPTITNWLKALGAWWNEDDTPWCGTFVAHCMRSAGLEVPKAWYRAKAWADWGVALTGPYVGCVVVFERQGGGHVGIVVGRDVYDNLLVLGGNQSDAVNIRAFPKARAVGYRWPKAAKLPASSALPLIRGIKTSVTEA